MSDSDPGLVGSINPTRPRRARKTFGSPHRIDSHYPGRYEGAYQNRWIPAAEHEAIKQQLASKEKEVKDKLASEQQAKQDELAKAEKVVQQELNQNSVMDARYRICDRDDGGAFIEIAGQPNLSGLAYLNEPDSTPQFGTATGSGTLYYSGSYQIPSALGGSRVIRTYHRNRDIALSHLRDRIYWASPKRASVTAISTTPERIERSFEPGFRSTAGLVWVNGYFKGDGTWVQGHYRKASSQTPEHTANKRSQPQPTSGYSGGSGGGGYGPVHVRGYYRKDGTYVRPHTRKR